MPKQSSNSLLQANVDLLKSAKAADVYQLNKAIRSGGDIRFRTVTGDTLLNVALANGRTDNSPLSRQSIAKYAKVFIAEKVGLDGEEGFRAFNDILQQWQPEVLAALFQVGIKHRQPEAWSKALITTVKSELTPSPADASIIDALLVMGVPLEGAGDGFMSPLGWAVVSRKDTLVKKLLAAGADPNLAPPQGISPMQAYWDQYTESATTPDMLDLLLEHGGDANARNSFGYTGLMLGAANLQKSVVRILLGKGADPTYKAADGFDAVSICGERNKNAPTFAKEEMLAELSTAQSSWELNQGIKKPSDASPAPLEGGTPMRRRPAII